MSSAYRRTFRWAISVLRVTEKELNVPWRPFLLFGTFDVSRQSNTTINNSVAEVSALYFQPGVSLH